MKNVLKDFFSLDFFDNLSKMFNWVNGFAPRKTLANTYRVLRNGALPLAIPTRPLRRAATLWHASFGRSMEIVLTLKKKCRTMIKKSNCT
jgi:hypothetical protein